MGVNRDVIWLSAALLLVTGLCFSQTLPSGFSQLLVTGGITAPTVMAHAPDGRIFVAQQSGNLRVIKNGALLPTPFVSLTVSAAGERGLIGIALDPDFTHNGYVYLCYTMPTTPARNRISRFTADGDVALTGSEVVVLDLDPLSVATNHNGGALAFGPDGKLYVAVGDNANGANAQNLNTYHGKILRINRDGSAPGDNPFHTVDASEQRKRVWAYGLRNPYTISFQPGTGRFYVNDVGANTWEEINDATTGGLNFGWPSAEGNSSNPAFTNPVYAYAHGAGDGVGCAITGGTFFNPTVTNYPSIYYGKYFYLDFCNRWINYINPADIPAVRSSYATTINSNPVIIETGIDGNLYYLSRGSAALFKIVYNNSSPPFVTRHPQNTHVTEGNTALFAVEAIGTLPLTYQWQKNGADIPGATLSSLTIANVQPADEGIYRCMVSNIAGTTPSSGASLTVNGVNDAPAAAILSPADQSVYTAGAAVSFSGTATDEEDGELPASAYTWRCVFIKGVEVMNELPSQSGIKSGAFIIPDEGPIEHDVRYRIYLQVTDSGLLTAVDSVDIVPETATLSFQTIPAGFKIRLNGQVVSTPLSVESVVGMKISLGIPLPQSVDGTDYRFVSWSQGGDSTQVIVTPATDVTYTATFAVVVAVEDAKQLSELEVYPNPVIGDNAWIIIHSARQAPTVVSIYHVGSSLHSSISVHLKAGVNHIELPIARLASGLHIIQFSLDGHPVTKRLIVIR